MLGFFVKRKLVVLVVVIILIIIGIVVLQTGKEKGETNNQNEVIVPSSPFEKSVIGNSKEGLAIEKYSFGSGKKVITLVGGIHGGYEWNTVSLAYEMIDYLSENLSKIPSDVRVDVIPAMNPDGLFRVTKKEGRFEISDVSENDAVLASGRFNSNEVDLNRNFDCKWEPESVWRSKKVSSGEEPFSEPESEVFKDYIIESKPVAVVFWHSQSNAVYTSQCEKGILKETTDIVTKYSKASGYPVAKSFDAYAITGAADDWLAKIGVPAFSVELKNHTDTDFQKNIAGVLSLFSHFEE